MKFRELLEAAQTRSKSKLAIGIAPTLDTMPEPVSGYDDPFLPFGKLVIDTTANLVCAYFFHLGAYLSIGAAGAVALERTISYVPDGIVKILHGPFASEDYASAAFEDGFGADAVTLARRVMLPQITPYLEDPAHGVFIEDTRGIANFPPILKLHQDYPGQFGFYRIAGTRHNELNLYPEPGPSIQWCWGDKVYLSRGSDFRDALLTATAALSGVYAS